MKPVHCTVVFKVYYLWRVTLYIWYNLLTMLVSAPLLRRIETISVCPLSTASWRAVQPWLSTSILIPYSSRLLIVSGWPYLENNNTVRRRLLDSSYDFKKSNEHICFNVVFLFHSGLALTVYTETRFIELRYIVEPGGLSWTTSLQLILAKKKWFNLVYNVIQLCLAIH